jgi:hypothetical protein
MLDLEVGLVISHQDVCPEQVPNIVVCKCVVPKVHDPIMRCSEGIFSLEHRVGVEFDEPGSNTRKALSILENEGVKQRGLQKAAIEISQF